MEWGSGEPHSNWGWVHLTCGEAQGGELRAPTTMVTCPLRGELQQKTSKIGPFFPLERSVNSGSL